MSEILTGIDRRKFIVASGAGTLALMLNPARLIGGAAARGGVALASERRVGQEGGDQEDPHFFVLIRTYGGMDCTLGLDPQVLPPGADKGDLFLEYRPADILQPTPDLRLAPAAGALAPFASSIATVNGIIMRRDLGHDFGSDYMASGLLSDPQNLVPVEMAFSQMEGPLGLVFANSDRGVNTGNRHIGLTKADTLLSQDDEQKTDQDLALLKRVVAGASKDDQGELLEAQRRALQSLEMRKKIAKTLNGYRTQQIEPKVEHVLAAAFTSEAAYQGFIDLPFDTNLDSHFSHEGTHAAAQARVWAYVAGVFKLFQATPFGSGSLFDATTFLVTSEFSRTPALNAADGKDHNPYTNSALLAGKNINGGKSYGSSVLVTRGRSKTGGSLHAGAAFDYNTGRPVFEAAEAKSFIFPENVIRTLATAFPHPDRYDLRQNAAAIPGLTK